MIYIDERNFLGVKKMNEEERLDVINMKTFWTKECQSRCSIHLCSLLITIG